MLRDLYKEIFLLFQTMLWTLVYAAENVQVVLEVKGGSYLLAPNRLSEVYEDAISGSIRV